MAVVSRRLFLGSAILIALAAPGATMAQSGQVPVLLVHGIWGSCASWNDVLADLSAAGFNEAPSIRFRSGNPAPSLSANCVPASFAVPLAYDSQAYAAAVGPLTDGPVVARLSFLDASGQSFEQQGRQVAQAVRLLREWTGASEVVVVGHSMGGLAARAYVQSPAYQGDVKALVTVATPHGGTAVGDIPVRDLPASCRIWMFVGSRRLDAPAIRNMLPGSSELEQLNQGLGPFREAPRELDVHALVADFEPAGEPERCGAAYRDAVAGWSRRFTGDLQVLAGTDTGGFLVDGGVMRLRGDGIVPTVSQHPGIALAFQDVSVRTDVIPGFHSEVLRDAAPRAVIVDRIRELAGGGGLGRFEDRDVVVQGEVTLRGRNVEFLLWDNARIDGDIVTLVVNGERVVSHLELLAEPHRVPVKLNRGENLVLIVAENVGRIPPNTAALAIDDGVAPSRTLVSNADLQTTAAYRVVVEIDGADDPGVIRASPWVALGGGAYRLSERLTSDATSMCLAIEASPLGLAPERLSAHDIERLYWTTGLAEVLIPNSPLFLSLQELVAVGRVVASLNHVIAQSTWFQDFAVRLGVHGTAAYLTGGASIAAAVPAEVRTQILGAFQDAPIAVATTLARLHIDAAVAAHARANALARDMEEGRTGASASSAIPIEVLDAAWADLAFAVSFSLPMAHFIVGIQPGTSIADQLRRIGVTFGLTTTGYMAPLASAVAEPLLMAHRYWELLAEMGEAGAQLRQDVAAKRTSFIPPPPGSPDSSGGMRALPPPCAVASGG